MPVVTPKSYEILSLKKSLEESRRIFEGGLGGISGIILNGMPEGILEGIPTEILVESRKECLKKPLL